MFEVAANSRNNSHLDDVFTDPLLTMEECKAFIGLSEINGIINTDIFHDVLQHLIR